MVEWILWLIGWTTAAVPGMPEPIGSSVGDTATEAAGGLAPNG